MAADQGYAKAENNLGALYYHGKGVQQNYEIAVELFARASQKGNPSATNNLGICYEEVSIVLFTHFIIYESTCINKHIKGRGVPRDLIMAAKLYKEASSFGHVSATNNLGYIYLLQGDYDGAASLFRTAADKGK
jgi:TPR repeat protein